MKSYFFLIFFCFSFSSCGYHFQGSEEPFTLSIPYVKGDHEGRLTNELIRQFAYSGAYTYVKEEGNFILKVVILDDTSEKIGFRYDRNELTGELQKNLQPTEDRRTVTAEVSLINAATDEVVLGPHPLTVFSDYDYTDVNSLRSLSFLAPDGSLESVLNFSLGQVDSVEGAQDSAIVPLYRHLAKKIVEGVLRDQSSFSSP